MLERQPGWQVELHTYGWGDPTAGLRDHASDAAFDFVQASRDAAGTQSGTWALRKREA